MGAAGMGKPILPGSRFVPDADALRARYAVTGSVSALARSYGVSPPTARGWLKAAGVPLVGRPVPRLDYRRMRGRGVTGG